MAMMTKNDILIINRLRKIAQHAIHIISIIIPVKFQKRIKIKCGRISLPIRERRNGVRAERSDRGLHAPVRFRLLFRVLLIGKREKKNVEEE